MIMETQVPQVVLDPPFRSIPVRWATLPRLVPLALIRLYQMTFSRLLPVNVCRFYPSCSHYGYQAIAKYGLLKGGAWPSGASCAASRSIRGGTIPSLRGRADRRGRPSRPASYPRE